MMEILLHWDTSMFHWINNDWSNAVFDFIFPALRNKYFWLPLYVLVFCWIMFNHHVRGALLIIFCLGLSIFASDTISSKLIKPAIERPRPCRVLYMEPPVIERANCGSGYSFPSSHAANHFCLASFFIAVFGQYMHRWKHGWWVWAALISIAQVYVGLHFPSDILGGALLGIIVGTSMGRFCHRKINTLPVNVNHK
ncbi:MAG TPA: phosphatase PAP2 family protein [Saprospiraceae bacterium]|nr:phosphatase PAP2 family protein [Saprospiraceae bacterium]